ncbi:hypothetical protein LCGC14_0570170 [marine sediment metagenome]|uniref:Uncharacterized protein n=1 Tax=marine sediment metagenome TaxID=412755 RepID=A0A0F9RJK6_9ZZZZ
MEEMIAKTAACGLIFIVMCCGFAALGLGAAGIAMGMLKTAEWIWNITHKEK